MHYSDVSSVHFRRFCGGNIRSREQRYIRDNNNVDISSRFRKTAFTLKHNTFPFNRLLKMKFVTFSIERRSSLFDFTIVTKKKIA